VHGIHFFFTKGKWNKKISRLFSQEYDQYNHQQQFDVAKEKKQTPI